MTLHKIGGFAGLLCAATHLFGRAVTGDALAVSEIDGPGVLAFIQLSLSR